MPTYNYGAGFTVQGDPGSAFTEGYKKSKLAKLLGEAYQAPEEQRGSLLAKMMQVDPETGMQAAKMLDPRFSQAGGSPFGVQSTYVDDQGRRVAIMRDGSLRTLGNNAPQNQIIDTGNGFYGVNKSSLNAAPVQVGGQPQQQPTMQAGQFTIDPNLPPEVQAAIRANEGQWANASEDAPIEIGGGGQLRSVPKPPPAITPYQQQQLDMARERMRIAEEARNAALEAKNSAAAVKNESAQRASATRQAEAASTAGQLVGAIDRLTRSPGFAELGTTQGDLKIGVPMIRNDVKDADAQLKNIAGQAALSTMARLKALSATGATGFGSLTAPELKLLENSMATLERDKISNTELKASLKIIRDSMDKVARWNPQQQAAPAKPASGGWSIKVKP